MGQESKGMGYCSLCDQNVLHIRPQTGVLASWLEWSSCKLTRFFGAPTWQCSQCGRRVRFLARYRQEAGPPNAQPPVPAVEQEGNFIRRDHSLVLRKQRAARFSQKYRDGIVHRLVSGTATLNQVSHELEISESDLMAWIADLLERREETIKQLRSHRTFPADQVPGKPSVTALPEAADGQIVEGQVHREDGNRPTADG